MPPAQTFPVRDPETPEAPSETHTAMTTAASVEQSTGQPGSSSASVQTTDSSSSRPAANDAPEKDVAVFDPHPKFAYTGSLRPAYPLTKNKKVPAHIVRPNYAREEVRQWFWAYWWDFMSSRNIRVNQTADCEGVRKASILAREVLMLASTLIKPGMTTDEIDKLVFQEAIKRDCYPSPLGYHGYPKSVCTSVNECICHGIPDRRPLRGEDIINIDVTLYHKGYHGDLNATWVVDPALHPAEAESSRLIRVARECLDKAIAICGPGVPYGEIGKVIQPHSEANGFGVVKRYTGHGVGKVFHGAPTVYHHKTKKSHGIMEVGHIFTIEPMISASPPPVGCGDVSWPDDWTVTTTDGAMSAAAEETLLITPHGVEILTAEGGPRTLDTRAERDRRGLLRAKDKLEFETGASETAEPATVEPTSTRPGSADVDDRADKRPRV
ncbi:unnamed protein product [Parajaminaea phylloscopi]